MCRLKAAHPEGRGFDSRRGVVADAGELPSLVVGHAAMGSFYPGSSTGGASPLSDREARSVVAGQRRILGDRTLGKVGGSSPPREIRSPPFGDGGRAGRLSLAVPRFETGEP